MTTLTRPALLLPLFSKLFWIRTNRVLAWSLVVSPVLQWLGGMPMGLAFFIDLGIMVAHGLLSLTLFGAPMDKTRELVVTMHVMGIKALNMSERNRFLLSGYRIALALGALALLFTPLNKLGIVVCMGLLYPILRLPVSVLQHIRGGVTYAMRRWGNRAMAEVAADFILMVYTVLSIYNMQK